MSLRLQKDQKKKQHNDQGLKKDISKINYYNRNKKGYYSRDFTEPKN